MNEKDPKGKLPRGDDSSDDSLPTVPMKESEQDEERPAGLPQYVTSITPVEAQVGMHVITALQHPETVAVLSTVVVGKDGRQNIISVGLDAQRLGEVQQILREAQEEQTNEAPCVGFHCYLQKPEADEKS